MADYLETQRHHLMQALLKAGIHDTRVLSVLAKTPRERFVDELHYERAYENRALPIDMGQTISQPLMVAVMTQALCLTGTERVLEIGTGSGYQTAILSQLAAYVYSIERHQRLAYTAARHLYPDYASNVSIYVGDGSLGWPDAAPYDRILVTAAAPEVPLHLIEQLAVGGLLVIPIGQRDRQDLRVLWRERAVQGGETAIREISLGACVFVPLVGQQGWHDNQ